MEDMSVQEKPFIEETKIFVKMEVENGLKPAAITFKKSSVGATETAMMAASLVEGTLCVCVWSTSLIKMVKHLTIGGGNFLPTQLIHDHLST
jgi:UDP-N-acetylglucosamine enolpyruvyl transferase